MIPASLHMITIAETASPLPGAISQSDSQMVTLSGPCPLPGAINTLASVRLGPISSESVGYSLSTRRRTNMPCNNQ